MENGAEGDFLTVLLGSSGILTIDTIDIHPVLIVCLRQHFGRRGVQPISALDDTGVFTLRDMPHHQIAVIVKTASRLLGVLIQVDVGRLQVHQHPQRPAAVHHHGRIDKGRAVFYRRPRAAAVVRAVVRRPLTGREVGKVVDGLPAPGCAAVLGDGNDGIQVIGRIFCVGPTYVRRGHNPSVGQSDQGGNTEIAPGLVSVHRTACAARAAERVLRL